MNIYEFWFIVIGENDKVYRKLFKSTKVLSLLLVLTDTTKYDNIRKDVASEIGGIHYTNIKLIEVKIQSQGG